MKLFARFMYINTRGNVRFHELGDLLPKLDALQGPALSQFDKCRKLARRDCGGLRYGCACVLHVATGEGQEGSGFVN